MIHRPNETSGAGIVSATVVSFVVLGAIGWGTPCGARPRQDPAAASTPAFRPAGRSNTRYRDSSSEVARAEGAIPIKVSRYVQRLLRKYDRNGDGKLQPREWGRMQGDPHLADANNDDLITKEELTRRVADYGRYRRIRPLRPSFWDQEDIEPLLHPSTDPDTPDAADARSAAGDDRLPGAGTDSPADVPTEEDARRELKFFVPRSALPGGLPEWFIRRDANGDAQLSLAEFAPKATRSELERFARYDINGDGMITTEECLRAGQAW